LPFIPEVQRMITAPLLDTPTLGIAAVQLGAVLPFLQRMATWHWLASPGSPSAVRSDLTRLQRTAARCLGVRCHTSAPGTAAVLGQLRTVEQSLAAGHDAAAAEAAQWFQWAVLRARAQGLLDRAAAAQLIDDAQALCEDLWVRERRRAVPHMPSEA
jgi:hypothetical protein